MKDKRRLGGRIAKYVTQPDRIGLIALPMNTFKTYPMASPQPSRASEVVYEPHPFESTSNGADTRNGALLRRDVGDVR
ncbi:MAG: hypothetical protein QM757_26255 [Paludibaculum sp.]